VVASCSDVAPGAAASLLQASEAPTVMATKAPHGVLDIVVSSLDRR
jgi:hypothetical protein